MRIYWFGHHYKTGSVKRIFENLDKTLRSEFRKYLLDCEGVRLKNDRFSNPSAFPGNLAFANDEIYSLGLASLVKIKEEYDKKVKPEAGSNKKRKARCIEIIPQEGQNTIKIFIDDM